MSQIRVSNLTFSYEGSFDTIFENVSFSVDSHWRLGFIGRNGKGKTTFLKLLMGQETYQGSISTNLFFDYFPYSVSEEEKKQCSESLLEQWKAGCEIWRVICELEKLRLEADILYRPFETLSHGERTKLMLAVLFSGENDFLLIDEPTNHLDQESRELVKKYLCGKKGFILASHDRDLLDACVNHMLVLNRHSIEIQKGNFSSWKLDKDRKDAFNLAQNEKLGQEIRKLHQATRQTDDWAKKNEQTKIGFDPVKEHDRCLGTRAYIGAKTKKLQSRVKQMEQRIERDIEKKEGLLKDIEHMVDLKIMPLRYHKERLLSTRDYSLSYPIEQERRDKKEYHVLHDFCMELCQGERVFLQGKNGCGKSSFLKAILSHNQAGDNEENNQEKPLFIEKGQLTIASGLIISYISQDTSYLKGDLSHFCMEMGLEESLFKAILRQLDFERAQFDKRMEDYSEGQKKKVLIAASLSKRAHLYIWDEPLNYIDIFSRMQIEKLILQFQPTMLLVEHDIRFQENVSTRIISF